jgi:hypothetical protein
LISASLPGIEPQAFKAFEALYTSAAFTPKCHYMLHDGMACWMEVKGIVSAVKDDKATGSRLAMRH